MTNTLATLRFAVLLAAVCFSGCSEAQRSPDVILVTLDTTRADHLGVYGYAWPTSPNLDGFAREAVTFRRAWSTSSWTLPAHASLFTGQHPRTHGARFNKANPADSGKFMSRLGDGATTVAEILADRGYATAAFAGGPWLAPEFGLLQGYQHQWAGLAQEKPRPRPKKKRGRHLELTVDWTAEELTDRAIAWLDTAPENRPVHLFVNYFDPHAPYDVKPGFEIDASAPRDGAKRKRPMRYDSEIRFMDHHFGRLLEALKRAGRYQNALIVVVADHGESFGERGNIGHGPWLYEEVLRVPLLVHFPAGREGGSSVEAAVSIVDLLPLIAAEVGFPLPENVEGVPIGTRDLVFSEVYRSAAFTRISPRYDRDLQSAIRWPWKLIVPDSGVPELYRLDEDPGESRPAPGRAKQAEMQSALDQAVDRMPSPATTDSARDIDPQLAERLRQLGYLP